MSFEAQSPVTTLTLCCHREHMSNSYVSLLFLLFLPIPGLSWDLRGVYKACVHAATQLATVHSFVVTKVILFGGVIR